MTLQPTIVQDFAILSEDLENVFTLKHGNLANLGWEPRARRRFRYFTPDDYYEALLKKIVNEATIWLDVGCGSEIMPNNPRLAKLLATKCKLLVGVDPDPAVRQNPYAHSYFHGPLESYDTSERFNLITLRMVAEHVDEPQVFARKLSNLLIPSGVLVVYTVNKMAVVPILTALLPFTLHHPIKKFLWGTSERETFPTYFRMNTRADLAMLFRDSWLHELDFWYLDDCRSFARFKWLHYAELALWSGLRHVGCKYLDNCLLGIYGTASSQSEFHSPRCIEV